MSNDREKTVPDAPVIPPAPPKKQADSYTLKHPLNMGDRKIEVVTPRRLTGKDQIEIEREIQATAPGMDYGSVGSGERMLRLIGKSCGLIFEDVQQLDASDVNALSARVDAFL